MNKYCFVFFMICLNSFVYGTSNQSICLLDVSLRNQEGTGNLFSAKHALIVSGVPYSISTNYEEAMLSKIILISGEIKETTFIKSEKDSLILFVKRGGTIICTQLKDPYLYTLFGINSYQYSTKHYGFTWDLNNIGNAGETINDPNEINIKLGDTTFANVFGTRGYVLSNALPLAFFEDGSVAFCKNNFNAGKTYLLGINWEDIILRNQVTKHFNASRMYSNGFEPSSDVFYHFIRGIFREIVPFASHKHTSISDSKSILVITHDVDATSAIRNIMTDFSSYEYENKIRSTYFVTTHYMHDSVAKNFWTGYSDEIKSVINKKHEVASHSVSHVPDFDNSSIVPLGDCGHGTMENYRPFYDGIKSNQVTVCGETEVSKKLLEQYAGANINSFRAGYLAYNKGIIEALEHTGYTFNSSHSANNVLTAYPFQGHINLSMNARESPIYEIPNTISDVFMEERISEENYNQKVAIWLDVQKRNADNYAPSILLIHPNRSWKIAAEQNFIRKISERTAIIPFEEFGHFWKNREACSFTQSSTVDSIVTIRLDSNTIDNRISFVIKSGIFAKNIFLINAYGDTLKHYTSTLNNSDVLISQTAFSEKYDLFTYEENLLFRNFNLFPNPINNQSKITFELLKDAHVSFTLFDNIGLKVKTLFDEDLAFGLNQSPFDCSNLLPGIYHYQFRINNEVQKFGKIVIQD